MSFASTSNSSLSSRFFEPSRLAGLEKMKFTARRRVEGAYSGRHVASRRGGSGEFVDYREYSPGDDLRRLDWKTMYRTGRTYLKMYQDETDLLCTILIDISGSMRQGSRSAIDLRGSKLEWIQYFSTALSHLVILGRDAVGLAVAGETLEHYLPPAGSIQHRGQVHHTIENLTPGGETRLVDSLGGVLLRARRRGVLLVISDFLVEDIEAVAGEMRKFRERGWEIIAIHLTHPDERALPEGNAFQFTGLENDGVINCQLSEIRAAYERRFDEHLKTTRSMLVSTGCDYHLAGTEDDYLDVLRSFMVVRS